VVTKILVNCFLLLLAFLLAYFWFPTLEKSKTHLVYHLCFRGWFIGLAIWLSGRTLLLFVGAALLFGLGELFKKR